MPAQKRTLAERVQSLEDWFAEAKTPIANAAEVTHAAPDPELEARRKLRASLDATRDIVMHRILDQMTAELQKQSVSTLRVANLGVAYGALGRSY